MVEKLNTGMLKLPLWTLLKKYDKKPHIFILTMMYFKTVLWKTK